MTNLTSALKDGRIGLIWVSDKSGVLRLCLTSQSSNQMETIDVSYFIKLFGGLTIVVSSIVSFIAYLIQNRLVDKWRKNDEKEIARLRGEMERNNSIITNLATRERNAIIEKKEIEAIEKIWEFFLKVKESIPTSVYSAYTFLTEDELTVENINKFGGTELSTLTVKDLLKNNVGIVEIEKYRPMVSTSLWLHLFAFQASIGRSKYLLIDGYHKHKLVHWKNDPFHQSILESVLSRDEIEYLRSLHLQSYDALIKIFEQRIVAEIQRITSGEIQTEDSFKLAKRMMQLIDKKMTE